MDIVLVLTTSFKHLMAKTKRQFRAPSAGPPTHLIVIHMNTRPAEGRGAVAAAAVAEKDSLPIGILTKATVPR